MLYSKSFVKVFGLLFTLLMVLPLTGYQQLRSTPADPDVIDVAVAASSSIQLNKNAVKFVRKYLRQNNDELVKIKERSAVPFHTMDKVFARYKLPVQLKYLAVIESELKTTAVSRVGAVGPWQ